MISRRGFLSAILAAPVVARYFPKLAAKPVPLRLALHPDAFAMTMEPITLREQLCVPFSWSDRDTLRDGDVFTIEGYGTFTAKHAL